MPKKPKNAIGPQLRRWRTRRSLSQEQLSAKFQVAGWDISRDVLARIENQTRRITDLELIDLARMLRVPVATLLGKGK